MVVVVVVSYTHENDGCSSPGKTCVEMLSTVLRDRLLSLTRFPDLRIKRSLCLGSEFTVFFHESRASPSSVGPCLQAGGRRQERIVPAQIQTAVLGKRQKRFVVDLLSVGLQPEDSPASCWGLG